MRGLYKYSEEFGRMGRVEGLFFADSEEVKAAEGKDIYMGEILGKHSEVVATINQATLTLITNNPEEVKYLERFAIDTGENPLLYVE